MLKIPYGQSNFSSVISEGYFYQDRTAFIRELETSPKFVFYLRPRRFGKSLFVSMLEYYYALQYKNDFQSLFGQLDIGKNPTPLANQYMVISFEFTGIMTNTPANTMEGFLESVRDSVDIFLNQYDHIFPPAIHASIVGKKQPNLVMKALFKHYNKLNKNQDLPPIYLVIDEYDHFTNELISFNFEFFAKSVTENGFVRKFYEAIKTATSDKIVDRLFITGVSPVTLDSMTSGFNIGTNLSLHPHFHSMMGFEEPEVRDILKGIGVKKADLTTVLNDLRVWYDGYLFHPDARSHVYNPDMVLYFSVYYQSTKKYPDDMLDTNIATDYTKIRNIFKIQQREDAHVDTLSILMDTGEISAALTKEFSLVKNFEQDDLVSLLFYMGFLTIKTKELGGFIFTFPNYVIEKLYADYFVSIVKQKAGLPIDNSKLNFAVRQIALTGTPQYLYNIVSEVVKVLSTRDAKDFNEMSLKAIIVSLLHQQNFYYVHSEFETEKQYVDVFLETVTGNPVKYEAAFELKYVKKSETINVETELDKAEIQLMNYMVTKKFNQRANLKAFVVLVHGTELHQREMIM
jgi:hypothetical protein